MCPSLWSKRQIWLVRCILFCCLDVNECANGEAKCGSNMHCENTVGSYRCLCERGFRNVNETTCVGKAILKMSTFPGRVWWHNVKHDHMPCGRPGFESMWGAGSISIGAPSPTFGTGYPLPWRHSTHWRQTKSRPGHLPKVFDFQYFLKQVLFTERTWSVKFFKKLKILEEKQRE